MALDSAPGASFTSASMKHSHSLPGTTVRAPIQQACDLPTQRGGRWALNERNLPVARRKVANDCRRRVGRMVVDHEHA
jgi:hypothetical protein